MLKKQCILWSWMKLASGILLTTYMLLISLKLKVRIPPTAVKFALVFSTAKNISRTGVLRITVRQSWFTKLRLKKDMIQMLRMWNFVQQNFIVHLGCASLATKDTQMATPWVHWVGCGTNNCFSITLKAIPEVLCRVQWGTKRICSTLYEEIRKDFMEEMVHQQSIDEWRGVHQEDMGEGAIVQQWNIFSLEANCRYTIFGSVTTHFIG